VSIRFDCPDCFETVRVREDLVGRRIRCPHCQELIAVPDEGEGPEVADGSRPRTGIGGYLGWIGLAIVAFGIAVGTVARHSSLPDGARLAAGILLLASLLVGEVACIVAALGRRGEAGGALGILLGLMFCAWVTLIR
jgi:DNA-directed RNA polymerase subunit RPC12/RpoP